jgi:hypothetical protein
MKVCHPKLLLCVKQKARQGIGKEQKMQERQPVHFLHIGKTGGTAITYALSPYPETDRYVIFRHDHDAKLRDIPKGEGVFFFLRDPIDRFVSGFYSRQRQGQPRIFSPWSDDEKIAFEKFSTPNELAASLSSVDEEKRASAQKAMRSIGHVRNSFWQWFESDEYFRSRVSDIFFIGFQESLTNDFEILKSKLGLPDSVKLPDDDIKAHRNPVDLDKSLEDKAVENLRHWYRDDFKLFDNCKEISARRRPGKAKTIIRRFVFKRCSA